MNMQSSIAAAMVAGIASLSSAQFVDDEFTAPALGSHWTIVDSVPSGSIFSLPDGNHFQLRGAEGSDYFWFVDNQPFIQQNAPLGTNWEIVTKIDNYNPIQPGFQRRFLRAGIQLIQADGVNQVDNDNWISIGILSDFEGDNLGVQAFWQADPDITTPDDEPHRGVTDVFPVTTGTHYLKIIKTTKGYQAQASLDGITYRNILPLIRNPATADGYFTNEKIRLYQSGGPPDANAGVTFPVDFDYIRQATVPAPPTGYTDDEFDGPALGPTWLYDEGVLPGVQGFNAGKLELTSGDFQDLWVGVDRAMDVYQDAPTSAAFDLTVKVSPTNMIPFEQFNSYGIQLWQDQSNWVFITNHRSGLATNRIEYAFKRNGLYDANTIDFGTTPCPEYLRVVQIDNTYAVQYSFDNLTFLPAPINLPPPGGGTTPSLVYPAKLKNAQVHLFSKKVFGAGHPLFGPPVTAQFDWLHSNALVSSVGDWELY